MNIVPTNQPAPPTPGVKLQQGFAKVVAGGRIIRIDSGKPYLERMVTGSVSTVDHAISTSKETAVLDSVKANLEAGIQLVDAQETSLAKIGGKLSELALYLNNSRHPEANEKERASLQVRFKSSQDAIFKESLSSFDQTALFSNGPSKPVTIAVPTHGEWEGLSVDRSDLGQAGLKSSMSGKIYGDGPGMFLDHDTIKRAFTEWRTLCTQNRMSWGMLVDRLHGISSLKEKVLNGGAWKVPKFPSDPKLGPLRRPHRNN